MKRRSFFKNLGGFSLITFMPLHICSKVLSSFCDACKEAWTGLSKFNARRYQFRYIEPTPGLPKVFLYGDSISIGYTEYVRASLAGKADVMRLHVNGNSSGRFIRNMEKFRKALFQPDFADGWTFKWDVIHFNVGLHDLKYLNKKKLDKENGKQVSSLEEYEKNLNGIIAYLKETYPTAKLIFATTTPVPEGEPGRFAGDAIRYNEVALKVLANHKDIMVNDLFQFSGPVLEVHGKGYGDVHYKAEGSRMQGIEVAQKIAQAINITPVECPSVEIITSRFKEYGASKKK